jgi:NADP-dependent aldehyde dehydrogenase
MGSLNPVIITEAALQTRGEEIADGLVASVATFGGQLCTKPGVVLAPTGAAGDALCSALARRLADRAPEVLLTSAIAAGFAHGLTALQEVAGVERLTPPHESAQAGFRAAPALFRASLSALHEHVSLREEHFGPAVIVFGYGGEGELRDALTGLGGQLSAAVHAEPRDYDGLAWLVDLCARCAGRVVFNGYPTGVSVCWAMQHGGPYPASSQAGHTSVGMTATRRFLRPVAFQNAPAELLPLALRDGNPLGLWRRVNGKLTGSAAGQTELDRRPGVPRRSAAPPVAR